MKLLAIVGVIFLAGLASGYPDLHPRGCIWIEGDCAEDCEEGTIEYSPAGDCGFLTPEPTCDQPRPKPDLRGEVCDFSACYCTPPTVRDTVSKKCIKLEDCPKKLKN